MQNLNSIERFLFNGNIYLIENNSNENNNLKNKPPVPFNINNKSQSSNSDSEKEKEKDNILISLKLLGSIINLYFYSKNPKKSYEQLKPFYIKNEDLKKRKKAISRLSSIKSQTSLYASESNFFGDEDASIDSQNPGNRHFIPRNLEDYILIKLPQNEIYMLDYNLDEALVEYKHKESGENFKFKFRHSTSKEKNYIRIMIMIEAYKYSIKNSLLLNPSTENQKKRNTNMSMMRNKTILTKRKNSISKIENVKYMTLDIMNTEFIINFLDNLIINKFKVLIIDENFFKEEQNLLKVFTNFLIEFKEIKFKLNLYEEEDNNMNEENLLGGETVNKETFVSAFSDRFNFDSYENKPQNSTVINNNVKSNNIDNNINKINNNFNSNNFQLLIIDASNTFMNNKGFVKAILPLAQRSPFLEKLFLNNNYLTDDIFMRLNELTSNFNIKIIDLSYNKIKGDNLSSNLRLLITSFFELELINLRGNLISTSFINKFNPIKFNNLLNNIRNILNEEEGKNDKEKLERVKIKIDLRENMIDKEKVGNQFYLWQSELFEQYLTNKKKTANESMDDFFEESENTNKNSKEKEKMNENNNNENEFKFNQVLYNTDNFIFLLDFPYKGPNYLEENNNNSQRIKKKKKNEYKIEIQKLIPKNNIDTKDLNFSYSNFVKGSLDYYREIFKFLFLIDYYFDPILNSFSHTYSAFIHKYREPLSPNNEMDIIETQLKKYLLLDNSKMDLYKDSLVPKYKNIMKTFFTRQIYNITRTIELKKKENNNNEIELDNEKISLKFDYKEIPLYEAKEIYYGYQYFNDKYESIFEMTKYLLNLKEQDFCPETGILFNPNSYIKHLFFFYKFILNLNKENNNFSILLSSYNKLISRIKIECYLAEKERDIYALKILSVITYGLGLKPYDLKIRKKYELLKIQSNLIDEGLEKLINFVDKDDVTLINYYYDIFMTEANNINYQSELTFIAEYIQFLRNNLIRKKIYEEIYEDKNSVTYITKVQNDFDDIYKKYLKISQALIEQIPEGIYYKEICVHPSVLDYLEISLLNKDNLEKDLETITEFIKLQNLNSSIYNINNNINNSVMWEYGVRNIFNRLTFLFMKNTKKEYPKKYGYSLSKKNKYLKLARLLFRFNNGLDGKNIYLNLLEIDKSYRIITENDILNSETTTLNPSLYNIVYCISNFNTNIKTTNKEIQRLNKEIISGINVIDNIQKLKLEILKFSPRKKIYPLIDLKLELKNITKEKRKLFQKISYQFYAKLLEINNNNYSRIIYYNRMYRKIKELLVFILNIKYYFKNEEMDENFLMIIYKEIFYICLKYMNRENFDFSFTNESDKNNNVKRFSFGILYIILFYIEFNLGLKIYIKEFLLDLYLHRYFPSYCKHALSALNNNYRYDWIMSSFEIHNRLYYNNIIKVKIYFTNDYYEYYNINEHTTVYDLFNDIFNNSQFFKNFKNKKLYWIYLVQNDPLKDELLPDEMKESYEQEINEIKNLKLKNNSIEENINNINDISINKNNSSINNSTFMSNTNFNLNKTNEKKKRKYDEDLIQYLFDNKGFNKGIFTLYPESNDYQRNNSNDFDYEDNIENINNNINQTSKKLNLNNNNKSESSSESSSSDSKTSNKNNNKEENKSNNNKKEEEKEETKKKSKEIINIQKEEIEEEKMRSLDGRYDNKQLKRINLKSNEFVLEFLGNIEDKLHFNFAKNLKLNMLKNKSDDEDDDDNSNNDEYNDNDISSSYEESDGPQIEKIYEVPGKILPDDAFKFDIIFNYFHFQICPRFYTINYLNEKIMEQGDRNMENISEEELDNIFELVSKHFMYNKRNNIVKYDLGKKLGILLIANLRLYNKEIIKSSKLIKYKKENLYMYFFPKNILKHSAFKNVMERMENLITLRMSSTINKNNLENEFIKLCMNYKEFYSTIYEDVYIEIINNDIAIINGINENLEPIHFKYVNICINFEGIALLEKDTYKKLLSFDFSDIVKIYLKNENVIKINIYNENKKYPVELKLNFIFNYKEEVSSSSSKNRKKDKKNLNLNEYDAYFLYEDIISLIQFNLLTNTPTKTVKKKEDFNFIYMKKNKYQNFSEVKKMNEIDIKRFKILKNNTDIYSLIKKKEEKEEKKEEEEEEKEMEEIEEKEEDEEKEDKIRSTVKKDVLSVIMRNNPQMAKMKEIREKEKIEEEKKHIIKRTNKSIFSSNSIITLNNENEDDFFSDVKVTGLNDNIEKNKKKRRKEREEKIKTKKIDIEQLLNDDAKTEDIMKEIEEEQRKWEEKINSSASSFSITSSMKDNNSNNEYKINIFKFNEMEEKEKKHIIKEKKLENKIENAQRLLKDRDLVSSKTKEKLNKERMERNSSNLTHDSMSTSTYLSFLSKNQRYPF